MDRMSEREREREEGSINALKGSDGNDNFHDGDDAKVAATNVFIISSLESGPAVISFPRSFTTTYIRCLLLRVRAHSAMKAVDIPSYCRINLRDNRA